jgi:hypothetical protein
MKIVKVIVFAILLAMMIGMFIVVSKGKSIGYAISPVDDGNKEGATSMAMLSSVSPFFLGVMIIAVIWALLWLIGDWVGE